MGTVGLSPGLKRQGRVADHSPVASVVVKKRVNIRACTAPIFKVIPAHALWRNVYDYISGLENGTNISPTRLRNLSYTFYVYSRCKRSI
jgi:hypothetical protein